MILWPRGRKLSAAWRCSYDGLFRRVGGVFEDGLGSGEAVEAGYVFHRGRRATDDLLGGAVDGPESSSISS